MAMFVHLTLEDRARLMRRNGIGRLRATAAGVKGIFAMPVMRNFYVSHQWLRELKRFRGRTMAGVYLRLSDEGPVYVGHYGGRHQRMTAAEAAGVMGRGKSEGWEVIIPRRVERAEIHRVRALPQVLGW